MPAINITRFPPMATFAKRFDAMIAITGNGCPATGVHEIPIFDERAAREVARRRREEPRLARPVVDGFLRASSV